MYDRTLIEYLPNFIRNIREIKAIMNDAEQPEIILSWEAIDTAFNDQFIFDASENAVLEWEKILGIVPKTSSTLDERKFTILARFNEGNVFTEKTLNDFLKSLCGVGYKLEINYRMCIVKVGIGLEYEKHRDTIKETLKNIVPCNMYIYDYIMYNTHNILLKYPHNILAQFTQSELKGLSIAKNLSLELNEMQKYTIGNVEKFTSGQIETFGLRKVV